MSINMALAGVPESLGIMVPFLIMTLLNLGVVITLFRNINEDQPITLRAV
jgi:hypothetical protein